MADQGAMWSDKVQAAIKKLFSSLQLQSYACVLNVMLYKLWFELKVNTAEVRNKLLWNEISLIPNLAYFSMLIRDTKSS